MRKCRQEIAGGGTSVTSISTCDVYALGRVGDEWCLIQLQTAVHLPGIVLFFHSLSLSLSLVLLSASLRSELNHLHASAIEHMRQTHQQETAAAKQELERALEQSRVQVNFIHSSLFWYFLHTVIVVSSILDLLAINVTYKKL